MRKSPPFYKDWRLLKEFENSPEANNKALQDGMYIERAHTYLFKHALKNNFTDLLDHYISKHVNGSNSSPNGILAFYYVLKNIGGASYLDAIKARHCINFYCEIKD